MAKNPLSKRLDALEPRGEVVVCIRQYDDQTHEEAEAAYSAEHGALPDGPGVLRVFIRQFCNLPAG